MVPQLVMSGTRRDNTKTYSSGDKRKHCGRDLDLIRAGHQARREPSGVLVSEGASTAKEVGAQERPYCRILVRLVPRDCTPFILYITSVSSW